MPQRFLTLTIAAVFALMTTVVATRASASGLANSGHDFSINTAGEGSICVVCHAASASDVAEVNQVVSNRAQHLFGGSGFAASDGDRYESNAPVSFAGAGADSRPCLGCHDGSVASDRLLHQPGNFGGVSSSLFGRNAARGSGHPVFVVYDGLVARRKGLFDPAITPSGLGGTIKDDLLVDSQIACSSCHGVHDPSGRGDFLRISNERSRLCLTCHDL